MGSKRVGGKVRQGRKLVGARAGFISYEEVDVGGVGVQQSPQGEEETPRKTRPEELSQTTPTWKREMGGQMRRWAKETSVGRS